MARDLRQVGYNRNSYPDKCYLYDSSAINNNKLIKDAKPICRFYKTDIIAFGWKRITVNGVLTTRKEFTGTIETTDHIEQARPDMYVVDQTGTIFIIDDIPSSDDDNSSKVVGTRPKIVTRLVLKGLS